VSLFSLGRRPRSERDTSTSGLIPPRPGSARAGTVAVNEETARRHSAVWAALRLRANLISTFPVDSFRKVGDLQVELTNPPVLINPGGDEWDIVDWMWASQFDLDGTGNAIGLVLERNGLGLPQVIQLQSIGKCAVIQKRDGTVRYRIAGVEYGPEKVWHERQYTVSGLAVGLSPLAYAAWSIGEYLSAQDFALDWFASGGVPKASLKNSQKKVPPRDSAIIKERWNATIRNGDLFVHGNDWEYDPIQAQAMGIEWLEARRFGLSDVARFLDVPADLLDAAISAPGSVTYASISQRNLQLLIMSLAPATIRREKNLSKLLPRPRFVKLNTDALLRMDPEAREKVISSRVAQRRLTVTEARALDNLPPLTFEQEAEFDRLFGAPRAAGPVPAKANAGELAEDGPVRVMATVGRPLGWRERDEVEHG
jgi:HK97 family phage portal protein